MPEITARRTRITPGLSLAFPFSLRISRSLEPNMRHLGLIPAAIKYRWWLGGRGRQQEHVPAPHTLQLRRPAVARDRTRRSTGEWNRQYDAVPVGDVSRAAIFGSSHGNRI